MIEEDLEKMVEACPKFMLNGPCGGVHQGICELEDRNCIWVKIFERYKKEGELEKFLEVRMPQISNKKLKE